MLMYRVFNFFIQLYTFIQYHYLQFEKKYWTPFLLDYFGEFEQMEEVTANCVKNGIEICDATGSVDDFDFIVYKKGIHSQFVLSHGEKFTCKLSSIKFMTVDLKMDGKSLALSFFEKDRYNYYVVNNRIDNKTLKFIINTHYSDEFVNMFGHECSILDNYDYNLNIIDQNVNIVNVNKCNTIIIEENDYRIVE